MTDRPYRKSHYPEHDRAQLVTLAEETIPASTAETRERITSVLQAFEARLNNLKAEVSEGVYSPEICERIEQEIGLYDSRLDMTLAREPNVESRRERFIEGAVAFNTFFHEVLKPEAINELKMKAGGEKDIQLNASELFKTFLQEGKEQIDVTDESIQFLREIVLLRLDPRGMGARPGVITRGSRSVERLGAFDRSSFSIKAGDSPSHFFLLRSSDDRAYILQYFQEEGRVDGPFVGRLAGSFSERVQAFENAATDSPPAEEMGEEPSQGARVLDSVLNWVLGK